jgi:outer membrane lipoprotein carrier protein
MQPTLRAKFRILFALVWLTAGLVAYGAPVTAQQSKPTLDEIIRRVEKRYAGLGFTADFLQESTIKAMKITDFASGKVFVRYPGMMRWEYEKPNRQVIITDGRKLWIYRPDDNQVMIGSAPAFFSDGKGASFLSDISLIRRKFILSMMEDNASPFYEIKMVPVDKTLDVSHIRLSVTRDTFTVARVTTVNQYGDDTHIEFINLKLNVALDDALFSFQTPEGADVLKLD